MGLLSQSPLDIIRLFPLVDFDDCLFVGNLGWPFIIDEAASFKNLDQSGLGLGIAVVVFGSLDGIDPFSEVLSLLIVGTVLPLFTDVKVKSDSSVDGSVEVVLASF